MIHFVGAGPGAPDLITVRGLSLIRRADCIIYAGSLVNPQLLDGRKEGCEVFDSARMTLEEVIFQMRRQEDLGHETVRLHTGDPCIYGAIREQMDALDGLGIPYDDTPGVSSFCGAAAALDLEYTLPGVSQTVILTRMEGRTQVPEKERIRSLAAHNASMVLFLSASMMDKVSGELVEGGYSEDTPAAIVYKASWPDEKKILCTVGTLAEAAKAHDISRTALIIVSYALRPESYRRSDLYSPAFETGYRKVHEGDMPAAGPILPGV